MFIVYNSTTGKINFTVQTSKPVQNLMSTGDSFIEIDNKFNTNNMRVNTTTLELERIPSVNNGTPRVRLEPIDFNSWFDNNITSTDDMKKLLKISINRLHEDHKRQIITEFEK